MILDELHRGAGILLVLGVLAAATTIVSAQQREQAVEPRQHADVQAPRRDRQGDPLPEGALRRFGTIRFRHPGSVSAIALSPDGKTIASEGSGTVRLWDSATGKPGAVLQWRGDHYGAGQNVLAFSPDGRKLFFTSDQGVVCHNLASGQTQVFLPLAEESKAQSVHVSPDGRLLAVGTRTGVSVLELGSGRERWNMSKGSEGDRRHDDRLLFHGAYSLALFAPDGKLVAVNASDAPKVLLLVDATSGKEQRRIELGERLVRLAFAPDSRQVAVTERDNAVRTYEVATGRRIDSWTVKLTNPSENYTAAVAYSSDGATLAVGATDNLIHRWNLRTKQELPALGGHTWYVIALVFAADGRWLYSGSWDGVIRRWDAVTGKEQPVENETSSGMFARSPVGSLLAWEADGGKIHLGDAATGQRQRTLPGNPAGLSHLSFAPDGKILAAGGNDMSVQLWESATGKLLRQWSWPKGKDPNARVDDLAFTPDGKLLASAGFRTHEILLWDVATGSRLAQAPHQMVHGVAVTPDGRTLVSAGWDRTLRVWSLPDLRSIDVVTLAEAKVRVADQSPDPRLHRVAVSPDGRLFATVDLGRFIMVWDAASRKVRHSFRAVNGQCNLAFSPDGQWLTVGGWQGELALWDVRTGRQALQLTGHPSRVFHVAYGPDGKTVLSGSDDNTVLVWSLRPKIAPADDANVAALWDLLGGEDAAAAYRALWQLADQPSRSVPFLKGKLAPAKPVDQKKLRRLFDELDSDSFSERDAASKELAVYGQAIEADLRREFAQAPSAEKRSRLRNLLCDLIVRESADDVRQMRALVLLGWAHSPEARTLLAELARGAPEARLTVEAKAALRRFD